MCRIQKDNVFTLRTKQSKSDVNKMMANSNTTKIYRYECFIQKNQALCEKKLGLRTDLPVAAALKIELLVLLQGSNASFPYASIDFL